MPNYHLPSMPIFLHYQIRFATAHAWVLAFEYRSAFFVLHLHMLIIFITLYTVKVLEDRSVRVRKVKCQKSQRNTDLTFDTRSSNFSKEYTQLHKAIDFIAIVARML